MKYLTLLFATLFLLSFTVGFEAELIEAKNQANESTSAEYTIQINNTASEDRTYSISSQGHSGVYLPSPSATTVEAQDTGEFSFSASPEQNQAEGNYRFRIFVRDRETGQIEELNPRIDVRYDYPLDFTTIDTDKDYYKPGDTMEVDVALISLDSSTVNDYRVNMNFLNQTQTSEGLEIRPESERNYRETFEIPENQPPGTVPLQIEIDKDSDARAIERNIEIQPHENITQSTEIENRILYTLENTFIQNTGNTELEHTVEKIVPTYLTPITGFSEEPDQTEKLEEGTAYRWELNLEQEEEKTITQNTRYWIPVISLTAILGLLLGVKQKISAIKVERKIIPNEKDLKIHIEIKNDSSKTFENLEVVEFVSDIAEVKKDFPMAKPEIRKKRDGTQLTWNIEKLEPGDQLVFEYKMQPKVEVEGGITLNSTKVLDSKGKKITSSKKQDTEA